ncbi:MAG: hypothetical protein ACLRR6_11050 [Oscillospiraceae bacterium]
MNWDFFFRQLSAGKNIDETCFSFVMIRMKRSIIWVLFRIAMSHIGSAIAMWRADAPLRPQKSW